MSTPSSSSIPMFRSNILTPLNRQYSSECDSLYSYLHPNHLVSSPEPDSPTSLGLANLEKLGADMRVWDAIGELCVKSEFQLHREYV